MWEPMIRHRAGLVQITSPSDNTCEKGTPGARGASYIKLTTKTFIVPISGIAVSGTFDPITRTPKSGFPYASRPATLAGNWQYMAFGSDAGHIVVFLSKWNTLLSRRDTIAFTDHTLTGMAMTWASFNIPLTYRMTSVFPNPSTAFTAVLYEGITGREVTVNIYDLDGRNLVTQHFNSVAGDNTFPLDIANIGAGTYIVRVSDGEHLFTDKLIRLAE